MESPVLTLDKKEWALLAIAAGKGKPLTPIQLQKVLFLFSKEMPGAVGQHFYRFKPYNYGPFDAQIYVDVETLADEGFVTLLRSSGQTLTKSLITPLGLERSASLKAAAPPDAIGYLNSLVAWATSISFEDLLNAVYDRFPDYATNSVFRGRGG